MSKSLQHFDFNFPNCIRRHYLCRTHSAAFSLNWLLDNDNDSATMMTMTMTMKLATGGRKWKREENSFINTIGRGEGRELNYLLHLGWRPQKEKAKRRKMKEGKTLQLLLGGFSSPYSHSPSPSTTAVALCVFSNRFLMRFLYSILVLIGNERINFHCTITGEYALTLPLSLSLCLSLSLSGTWKWRAIMAARKRRAGQRRH